MPDGRRDTRIAAHIPVKVRWPGRELEATANLSAGGVQIHTRDPLNVATMVAVELQFPLASVNVLGHVRWATADSMGIQFDDRDERVEALMPKH
jgi:hypothetical protein